MSIQREEYSHVDVCKEALTNINTYNTFKQNPLYTKILQHCPHEISMEAYKKISAILNDNDEIWKIIALNDTIGKPQTYKYGTIPYELSPTTMLYVYQAMIILNKIKNKKLTICEIGSGYGGLCFMLHVFATKFNVIIQKYTLIDLEHVVDHAIKYVNDISIKSKLDMNVDGIQENKLEKIDSDLVISIYAIGELPKEIVDRYIDKVFIHASYYYLWWNLSNFHPYFTGQKTFTGLNISGHNNIITNIVETNIVEN